MSRSNKELKCGHSGYTIDTGHGGMKRNKADMAVGARIKPQDYKSTGMTRMQARQAGGSGAAPSMQHDTSIGGDNSSEAWEKIGKAGASAVKTYKSKQEKKKASSSGETMDV